MTRRLLVSAAVLVTLLTSGCGSADDPTAGDLGASNGPALRLEPAVGDPVVVLSGLVNGGEPLAVDLASLDALPNESLTVLEPFLQQSMTFTGVGFGELLGAARATGKTVTIHALDDYEVTFDATVLSEPGVMLATEADGAPIDGASGGPVRLVFSAASDTGKDSDLWVWSIDQITVE